MPGYPAYKSKIRKARAPSTSIAPPRLPTRASARAQQDAQKLYFLCDSCFTVGKPPEELEWSMRGPDRQQAAVFSHYGAGQTCAQGFSTPSNPGHGEQGTGELGMARLSIVLDSFFAGFVAADSLSRAQQKDAA